MLQETIFSEFCPQPVLTPHANRSIDVVMEFPLPGCEQFTVKLTNLVSKLKKVTGYRGGFYIET